MFISYQNGKFEISRECESAVTEIEAPAYIENGEEKKLSPVHILLGAAVYADNDNFVEITVEKKSDTLFYIRRSWTNLAVHTRKIQTVFSVGACFAAEKYLIPCVNVNGNMFGKGQEPKGLKKDGKPWIFGYDRVSIPACTLVENEEFAVSLFVSAGDEKSLCSSCSIIKEEETGRFRQLIYHPVIESPVTYSDRDQYTDAYENFMELEPGECFICGMYLVVSKPVWKNFGICHTLDLALGIFGDNYEGEVVDKQVIWDVSMCFARSLISDYKGKKGFHIGYLPDGKGGFAFRWDSCFELAWAGQNVLFCRMFIEDYIRNRNRDSLDTALEILDTRVKYCTAKSGLIAAQLSDFEILEDACADTCNMGYGAYELLRCYKRLKEIDIEREEYLNIGRGVCDFFCEHFSEEFGFGKQWSLGGECMDTGGSAGAFLICPMAKLYELTGEEKYLHMAEKALRFYMERDLNNFCCKAGALDTDCVDKESSVSFLISALLLYETTRKDIYLEYSRKAAYYMVSWMFHYQPIYGKDTDIAKYNVCIKGLTSVSAQHHHLDVYASLAIPYLRKMADYTGDERWRTRAEMMWRAVLQCIGDGSLKVHGVVRPEGSQNEAVFHCRWGFGAGNRGTLNDWLVAWPCAFRMSVLAEDEAETAAERQ